MIGKVTPRQPVEFLAEVFLFGLQVLPAAVLYGSYPLAVKKNTNIYIYFL